MPKRSSARPRKPKQSAAIHGEPSKELKALYEQVITNECAPGLSLMYQGLPEASKKKLLQALRESLMHRTLTAGMVQQFAQGSENITIPRDMEQFLMASSLANVLQMEEKSGQRVKAIDVAQAAAHLQTWGRGMTMSKEELRAFVQNNNAMGFKQMVKNQQFKYTSASVTKPESERGRDVSSFKPVTIFDLKLFEVAKGCSLTGTLVADAMPMVCIVVHLEDSKSEIVTVGLYNQIPGGKSAMESRDYVRRSFPQGARITIIEPFFKIAADGQRVIRADDPADVIVKHGAEGSAGGGFGQTDLPDAIEESMKLLKEGSNTCMQ